MYMQNVNTDKEMFNALANWVKNHVECLMYVDGVYKHRVYEVKPTPKGKLRIVNPDHIIRKYLVDCCFKPSSLGVLKEIGDNYLMLYGYPFTRIKDLSSSSLAAVTPENDPTVQTKLPVFMCMINSSLRKKFLRYKRTVYRQKQLRHEAYTNKNF